MEYITWSLRQIYLFTFLPTEFQREADERELGQSKLLNRSRINYLFKILPWILAFNMCATLIAGYVCEAFGMRFNWLPSLLGAALGVIGGTAFGVPAGTARAIGGGLAGWTVGVTLGLGGSTATRFVGSVIVGMIVGIGVGVLSRPALRNASGVWRAVLQVIVVAVAFFMGIISFGTILINIVGSVPVSAGSGYAIGTAFSVAGGIGAGIALGVSHGKLYGLAFGAMGGIALALAFLAVGALAGNQAGVPAAIAFGMGFPIVFWMTYFRLLVFPLDVTLTTATYLTAKRWPLYAIKAWRWCPIYWSEVIWLPLPFLDKLLVQLVLTDRDEGFKEITFVAAERQLQRRAAVAALVELAIIDLRAASVWQLAEVTETLNWTTDVATELPTELATALQRFDLAAQHAGQYVSLNSIYLKSNALSQALAQVGSLQRSLITSTGRFAPRILQVANHWRALLEVELENVQSQAALSQEIPNPFIFGNPVVETENNIFIGRRDVIRQIEASMLGAMQTPTLLLYGPRRMGKTSILNQLPRLLGPNFAPSIVDCQNPAVIESRTTLLRYLSRSICEGLRRRHLKAEMLTAASFGPEPFTTFDEWLSEVESNLPERMRVLLCLDEYEHLQQALDAGWGAPLLDALRHLLQHRPKIGLMFTGAHTFQELGPAWTDRFISARRVKVSFLKAEEVRLLLTNPIPEFNVAYEEGTLAAIHVETNGQPFLAQAVAFELVQLLNERHSKEAKMADVHEAVNRALISGGEYFANLWSDARSAGQSALISIANGGRPSEVSKSYQWLFEHDVLSQSGEIAVPMVKRWLLRKQV